MPVPKPRDPEFTRRRLEEWLPSNLTRATDVRVTSLDAPSDGYSNETIFFDVSWTQDGQRHAESLVLRIQPQGHQLFFEGDVRDVLFQYRVMQQMERHGVPVAPMRWAETDARVLGGPFFIMERVHGHAPTDTPSYNATGVMVDMGREKRRSLWQSGMEALAKIQSVDWRDGLEFLSQEKRGAPGLGQQMVLVEDWYAWATKGRAIPILVEALDYVRANMPADEGPVSVVWGDSRIGNMIFNDDQRVVAVTDWEMAGLGPPEIDLGWWLFMDHWHAEGHKATRLDGLPDEDETIAVYESLTGHRVRDIEFYKIFAGLRFGLIVAQSVNQREEWGMLSAADLPEGFDPRVNNGVSHCLAALLDLSVPSFP